MDLTSDSFYVYLAVFGLILFGLYIWSIFWAYQDAVKRGKPGWMVALLVAVFSWPLSLLLWLVFRPDLKRPDLPENRMY